MKKKLFLLLGLSVFPLVLSFAVPLRFAQALPEKIYKSLDLFTKVMVLVEKDYVEEVDGENLVYGAIKGMLGTLDPYSVFLTPDVYKELKVETVGRFGGVGLEITLKDGVLTVVTPMEDTPAARAGIQPGDRIVKINGTTTKGMNLADAVRRMRGLKKSKVVLTLWREGRKKPFDVSMERETIKVKSVKWELLPDRIGILRITSFQEHTSNEIQEALKEMEKSGPLRGLVLDLRNNPGGLLEEAVFVSDMFLPSGEIVSTRGRSGTLEVRKATGTGAYTRVPMVILLNEGSASASEIVAAALRDNDRAKIVGQTSFGKGSVQTVIDLGEGTGLKLTVAKYYTPAGISITGKGIAPDFAVELPEDVQPFTFGKEQNDPQRQAALLYLTTGKVPQKFLAPIPETQASTELPQEVGSD